MDIKTVDMQGDCRLWCPALGSGGRGEPDEDPTGRRFKKPADPGTGSADSGRKSSVPDPEGNWRTGRLRLSSATLALSRLSGSPDLLQPSPATNMWEPLQRLLQPCILTVCLLCL